MTTLQVDKLVVGYGAHDEILKGVGLDVADEIVVIIGPNGAGKSTLLKAIAGLVAPRSGSISYKGVEIGGLQPSRVAKHGIAFVPQDGNIFPTMTVRDNLEVAGFLDPAEWRARMRTNFERFPMLAERQRAVARTLSGGQRQTLAMGMGLMIQPSLMLLDEPSAGLSPKATDALFDEIRTIAADGITVLMVEQNALQALRIADRAYLLVDGRNVRDGEAAAMAADPSIRRLFLGD